MPEPSNNASTGILTRWKTALLHLSIQYKFQNLTNYLITHGCELDSQDEFGKTPLLKATYKLQNQTVEILLTENADMMVPDSNGRNALQTALEFPSISECRPIIKSFASRIKEICANDIESIATLLSELECPLTQVIYFGDASLTRAMLKTRGYEVNRRNPSDGNTALHVAVMLLDLENVEALLQFGADRNAVNNEGCMPFFPIFASKKCEDASARILELVMPANVDWTKCDKDGRLKLYPIFVDSSARFLRIFLNTYDIDLRARDADGKTVLHYLVERDKSGDSYDIFETAAIDVNARDSQGRTPLHVAAMRANSDAVKFLLDRGADTRILHNGETPIYLAFGREATMDPQRCIALLLQTATIDQLTSNETSIYMRIFRRFDDDEITFCKSVTAHFALLEKTNRPTLKFDPSVPFYVSSDDELEPYYRRIWRKRMATVTMYHWAYKEELDEMKEVMVYGSVSLFDVLVDEDGGRVISRHAWKSEERVEELRKRFYKETYAFYYKTRLTTRFDNAGKVARWRNEVARILSETGLFREDHVAVEKIVRMLEYDDLKRFG